MRRKPKITKVKKEANIVNMTGHTLKVGEHEIESDGLLRISFAFIKQPDLINGKFLEYKALSGCNEEIIPIISDTIYIVSETACQSLPHRKDLYMCHSLIKASDNRTIIGARGLKVNPFYKE